MGAMAAQLRAARRPLMLVVTLFFVICLVEVDIGHQPSLDAHRLNLSLLPILWLALSLLALIALQVWPSSLSAAAAQVAMVISVLVGLTGVFAHLAASGVSLGDPGRALSVSVLGGPQSPNWPVAIVVSGLVGFVGALGAGDDARILPRDASSLIAGCAFILIVAGIVLNTMPSTLAAASACLVGSALLLLAALLGSLATSLWERKASS